MLSTSGHRIYRRRKLSCVRQNLKKSLSYHRHRPSSRFQLVNLLSNMNRLVRCSQFLFVSKQLLKYTQKKHRYSYPVGQDNRKTNNQSYSNSQDIRVHILILTYFTFPLTRLIACEIFVPNNPARIASEYNHILCSTAIQIFKLYHFLKTETYENNMMTFLTKCIVISSCISLFAQCND